MMCLPGRPYCFLRTGMVFLLLAGVMFGSAALAAERPAAKPAVLFITHRHPGYWPSHDYLIALGKAGYELHAVSPKETTPELLTKYNVVVLFGVPIHEPTGEATDVTKAFIASIKGHVDAGGGVLFSVYGGPYPGQGYGVGSMLMAEALGAKLLWEEISDPETAIKKDPTGYVIPFAYTRELQQTHPITKGLEGVWYPTGGFAKNVPTVTWLVGDGWTVLVKGSRTSSSRPIRVKVPFVDRRARSKGFPSYVPILTARQQGRGRVILCGISPLFHFLGGHQAGLKRIVSDRGYGGRASDLDKILFRGLKWLAEPSMKAGRPGGARTAAGFLDDPLVVKAVRKLDWSQKTFGPAPKQYRGVIGARTSRSRGGKGSVDDYVRAARKAGHQFIVFLETWNDLTAKEWDLLIAECRAARRPDFVAYVGITFRDKYGGHKFAFGEQFELPGPEFTTRVNGEKRFWWLSGKIGVAGLGLHVWRKRNKFTVRVGSWRHAENPWPYYSERDYDTMAVIAARGAKVTEDILDGYLHLQNRGEALYPVAVTIIRSPDELAKGLAGGMYWNAMTDEAIKKNATPGDMYMLASDLRYLSNGPRIDDFRFMWHRDYAAIESWWRTDWYRTPLRIAASSDAGLKEVLLLDGPDRYRRWLPGGAKTFVEELTLCNDAQHDFILVVTDRTGRRAISSELITRNHMGNETMCADRNNQMGASFLKRADGRIFKFQPSATPWKGNNDVRLIADYSVGIDPITGGGVRGIDGARGTTAQAIITTTIMSKAVGTKVYGFQFHRVTDRVVGSPDMTRGWGRTDGRMVVDKPRNVWYDLVPVVPAPDYQEWGQRTYFTVWPEMLAVEMLQRRLSVLQKIDLKKAPAIWRIGMLRATGAPKLGIRSQGRIVYDGRINDFGLRRSSTIDGVLGPGDYVAYYDGAVNNIAYMVYKGTLRYSADLRNGWITLYAPWDPKKTVIPAGTTIEHTLFSIVAPNLSDNWPADSLQFAERFRDDMGLDGDVPYRIIPTKGKVISTNYVAVVEAHEGQFVAKGEGIHLPASLPLEVRGLNSNWSSGFADLKRKRYRPIAIHRGTSHVSLSPLDAKPHFFVGHPAVADDPDVVLACVQLDATHWALEVHNPTDKPREVTVRPSSGLSLLKFSPKRVKVSPGTSVHIRIQSKSGDKS